LSSRNQHDPSLSFFIRSAYPDTYSIPFWSENSGSGAGSNAAGWFFCFGHIVIQQKDMPVDSPGAACPAACAPEPGRLDLPCQTFQGVRKETVALLHQCDNAIGDRERGRSTHQLPFGLRIQTSTCRNGISIPSFLNRSSIRKLT